jgi:hypothetical protein
MVKFAAAVGVNVALAWALFSGGSLTKGDWRFLVIFGLWVAASALAIGLALRLPRRHAAVVILLAGFALRLAALAGPPTTSDDLYRYSWDGRVQAAGVDSYAWAPAAGQLANLRESWLWPSGSTCGALGNPPGCTRINRPDSRTIYPPVAEAWFAAVYRVAGIGSRYKAWQVAGLLTELATLALLVVALRRWGRDTRWVALYALCPAPALEIVNNGHVDGLAILFVVAALAVAAPGRRARAELVAAALLGAAVLVKLYPAVLLVPLIASQPGPRLRIASRVGALVAAMVAIAYAPHVIAVGTRVLGYLPGYLREEGYRNGGRYLIAFVLHVPHSLTGVLSLAAVAAVALWVVVRRPPLPPGGAAMLAALLLALSPAQPWYAVSLVAVATVAARPRMVALVGAGYVAAFSSVLERRHAAFAGGWANLVALAVLAIVAVWPRTLPGLGDSGQDQNSDGHDEDLDDDVGRVVMRD